MKTIELLGGVTSESSGEYYRIINEATRKKRGGIHSAKSVMGYWEIIDRLADHGAQGIILGCTEILLFDTTRIHSLAAVEYALNS